jgi:protein gp37
MRRKPDWWWDTTWSPVSGCVPVSTGCKQCWSLPWLKAHTWKTETVYSGAIEPAADGSVRWTGRLTALRAGDRVWSWPLRHRSVENPALGPGMPNLIFAVVDGDLFAEGRPRGYRNPVPRPRKHIDRVCRTLVASRHIGILCSKYVSQMADYFATVDPRSVSRWQSKLLLGFSAENQEWFDARWAHVRPLADAGWFTFVALSPLLEPVTLPPEFLARGRRTWVVVYGECNVWQRDRCRLMHADWVRALRTQCRTAGIPFFLRGMQTGVPIPPDLHIRQFPLLP